MDGKKGIVFAGGLIGIIAVLLVFFGNPPNMGFCIACFLRDTAGAVGLHRAEAVQYIRPEIIGLVLGAFFISHKNKEFESRGGSAPFTRFMLGMVVMIGALIFLGCPLRMVLRLGGGDLNAIFGMIGFVLGIFVGVQFLNRGFNLKRNYKMHGIEGYIFPAVNVGLLVLLLTAPAFVFFSEKGPGSLTAPVIISLIAGLIVGALAQKTRLCMVGGTRDMILFKDNYLLIGFVSIIVFSFITNLIFGYFNLGFNNQPIAHTDGLWNFLGMALVGWGSVLLGGCPLRQLILSGEGNTDSVVSIMGMLVGAGISHNFGLASSTAGATSNGKIAVIICFIFLGIISYFNSDNLPKTTTE
ncbi:MAG TPA: YedE family putative selenium transporter [Bacillota bacterium]|nr:YedE family putative selenium transporter [Bacillota bacterium]HPL54351.1 YedE family putative selenium transporter [Bacillota bacterium]